MLWHTSWFIFSTKIYILHVKWLNLIFVPKIQLSVKGLIRLKYTTYYMQCIKSLIASVLKRIKKIFREWNNCEIRSFQRILCVDSTYFGINLRIHLRSELFCWLAGDLQIYARVLLLYEIKSSCRIENKLANNNGWFGVK